MTYLLDTNICIYLIKKKPQTLVDRLRTISSDEILISSITVAELEYGVRKSSMPDRNQQALNDFLTPFTILDFDFLASIEYGIIRTDLERKGTPVGSLDMLIAAQARSQNLILVTNNEKEFRRIESLKVDNWII